MVQIFSPERPEKNRDFPVLGPDFKLDLFLENLSIFSNEVHGSATPRVTITVDGVKFIG